MKGEEKSISPVVDFMPFRLKDPLTAPYVLCNQYGGSTRTGGGGCSGGSGGEMRPLTEEDREMLENRGRANAKLELERNGFSVVEMPRLNPGHDLLAKKEEKELHVETKAHNGRATVVEVTHQEYKEYLNQQGYQWEVLNVEHLAEDDANPLVITKYDTIPEDALDTLKYLVDLKSCPKKIQD